MTEGKNFDLLRQALDKANSRPRPRLTSKEQAERARQDNESVEAIGLAALEFSRSVAADRVID